MQIRNSILMGLSDQTPKIRAIIVSEFFSFLLKNEKKKNIQKIFIVGAYKRLLVSQKLQKVIGLITGLIYLKD